MTRTTCALVGVFTLTQACATVAPRPITLPPPDAPLEHRVAAYRARAAMPHMDYGGWALRLGTGNVHSLDDARPFVANSREAEAILHARDNQMALGWSIFGAGIAVMLSSLFALPAILDSDRDRFAGLPVFPFVLIGVGALISLPSAFILGSAQRRIPTAAEAYNNWLWSELRLPSAAPDGSPPAPTPHPASTPTPWSGTP